MSEILVKSNLENLNIVLDDIFESLEDYGFSMKFKLQLELVIEELFLNICYHAYETEGDIKIQYAICENPLKISVTFIDSGMEFNPLEVESPDLTLGVDEREIGGLGLVLVKENVDDIRYKYENGQNLLTFEKIESL